MQPVEPSLQSELLLFLELLLHAVEKVNDVAAG